MADELVLRDKCCPLRNFPSETRSVYSLPVFMSLLPSRVCSPVAADTIVLSVNSVVEHLTALESNHQQEKNNKRTEWALASLIIGQKYKTAKVRIQIIIFSPNCNCLLYNLEDLYGFNLLQSLLSVPQSISGNSSQYCIAHPFCA
ncbi:uncharacterized protein LOC122950026 isoform X1 [Acropora millepora]|uniref:uncharacterized protein LOC122950026 isoform X1 n=1 Tax=Acropora millepora TaxID=45264 RepID=UPI001CF2DA2E|nr:uncharacterized protein LOC122950026 isoform X1 [Acropora millepora]